MNVRLDQKQVKSHFSTLYLELVASGLAKLRSLGLKNLKRVVIFDDPTKAKHPGLLQSKSTEAGITQAPSEVLRLQTIGFSDPINYTYLSMLNNI